MRICGEIIEERVAPWFASHRVWERVCGVGSLPALAHQDSFGARRTRDLLGVLRLLIRMVCGQSVACPLERDRQSLTVTCTCLRRLSTAVRISASCVDRDSYLRVVCRL